MKSRSSEKEKLDDLSLQGKALHKTLQSLEWINRWLGNHRSVINAVHHFYQREKKTLHIVDLGCGGGDLALAIAKSLRKHKIKCSITGIDGNANTLIYAENNCAGFPEINFLQYDILQPEFSLQPCDLLISSHFMYHFREEALIHFLKNKISAVSTAVIISELKRNRLAMCLFKITGFLMPISKLSKEDGLLAIKRSLTIKEWLAILQQAGIGRYRLQRVFFFRILLTIWPTN